MLQAMHSFNNFITLVKNLEQLLLSMRPPLMFLLLTVEDSSNIMDQLTLLHSEEEHNLLGTSQIMKEFPQQEMNLT